MQRGSRGGAESLGSRPPGRWGRESIPARFVACPSFSSTGLAACCHTLPFLQITFDEPFTLESTTHQNSSHGGAIQHYQSLIEAILPVLEVLRLIRDRERVEKSLTVRLLVARSSPRRLPSRLRLEVDHPPAGLARPLVLHSDELVVQREVVAD